MTIIVQTSFSFEAIGTDWLIQLDQPLSKDEQNRVLERILDRIALYDKTYSRFRSDSLVSQMANKAGSYILPSDAPPLLDLFHQLWHLSGGLFTPMIGQTLVDAGYDSHYRLTPKAELYTPPPWEEVMSFDGRALHLQQPVLLDFGAGGKGYLIDIVSQLLNNLGLSDHSINAGGDIVHHSSSQQMLRVGLENPTNLKQVIGIAKITNQSICGSAGNRRAWDQFHHIINPQTLSSPRHILACWVITDTGLLADALSTALFFVTPEQLRSHFTFEYAILTADYALHRSPSFPAEVFTI